MVTGALQVPPNGLPIIFLADHPTTGGSPGGGSLTAAGADLGCAVRLRSCHFERWAAAMSAVPGHGRFNLTADPTWPCATPTS